MLVLDDVHNVDSAESLAVLDALAEHLPPSSHARAVRADPIRPAARSPVAGSTRASSTSPPPHLALDATETDELLTSMGVRLELEALTQLCDRFEGWAAGIRLAGLVPCAARASAVVAVARPRR